MNGEEDDDQGDPEEQVKTLKEMKQALQLGATKVSEESIKEIPELQREIAEFEVPENIDSLLQREAPVERESLLAREE